MVGLGLQGAIQGSFHSYYTLLAFAHIHSLAVAYARDTNIHQSTEQKLLRYSCNVSHMSSVAQVTGSYQTLCSVRGTDVLVLALMVGSCE